MNENLCIEFVLYKGFESSSKNLIKLKITIHYFDVKSLKLGFKLDIVYEIEFF